MDRLAPGRGRLLDAAPGLGLPGRQQLRPGHGCRRQACYTHHRRPLPDYFTSQFTPSEWTAAFRNDPTGEQGRLLPVRVRPCDVEGLLGQIVYIDLVDQDEATARATLLQGITHERRKHSSPPAFPLTHHAS